MSEETLHTASRRAVRFFNIDICHGGIIVHDTECAFFTLAREADRADPDDPLLPTARVALVHYDSDMNGGGLIRPETQLAMSQLDRAVRELA